jgi:hypothetical protein
LSSPIEKELADVEAALRWLEVVRVADNTDKHADASDE